MCCFDVLSCLSGFSDGFPSCSDWIWCFDSLCHRRVCSFLVVIWVVGFRSGSCVFLLFVRHFWLFVWLSSCWHPFDKFLFFFGFIIFSLCLLQLFIIVQTIRIISHSVLFFPFCEAGGKVKFYSVSEVGFFHTWIL